MRHKLCAICPVCAAQVSIDGRRVVRHTKYYLYTGRGVCEGTNAVVTDDAVRAWLIRESKNADNVSEYAKKQRTDADNLRATADRLDAEAADLRAFVAAQLAKLGGAS